MPNRIRNYWRPLRAVLIGFVVAAVYVSALWLSFTEADRRAVALDVPPTGADYLSVAINVVHVDLLNSEMTTRISIHVAGKLAKDELTPATDVKLVLNTIKGPQEFNFKKGQRINPIEAVFPLEGDVSLYPFDRHKGVLWLVATLPGEQQVSENVAPEPPAKIVPDELAMAPSLPVGTSVFGQEIQADTKTTLSALIPGLTFRGSRSIESANALKGLTGIEVNLKRSPQVVFISIITMLMMAGLSGGLVTMVLQVVGGSRNMTSFQIPMAVSLIFGLPALRNIQPGVPPPGTFGDSIVFTWAEMIAAASAVTLIIHWLLHRSSMTTPPSS